MLLLIHPLSAAAAVLFKNEKEELVKVASQLFTAASASIAEANVIRVGLLAAIEAGFTNVVVESGNLNDIRHINFKVFSVWESAVIKRDIYNLSSLFHIISFYAISRSCDHAAD
ncbi:hypothetical protein V6N11_012914 [Hibiscus sabdariffa]|uniref:RNase H type-1 domain-containing protein n=1 Tax=Hibiscus sabdariffa TaxID=183260 RepID=A0ABR2N9I9_9ROSI